MLANHQNYNSINQNDLVRRLSLSETPCHSDRLFMACDSSLILYFTQSPFKTVEKGGLKLLKWPLGIKHAQTSDTWHRHWVCGSEMLLTGS